MRLMEQRARVREASKAKRRAQGPGPQRFRGLGVVREEPPLKRRRWEAALDCYALDCGVCLQFR